MGHQGAVHASSWSPDGKWVLTASGRWDGPDFLGCRVGQGNPNLEGHAGPVQACSFSPDGLRMVTGGTDGTARIWRPAAGQVDIILRRSTVLVLQGVFSPDRKRLATIGLGNEVLEFGMFPAGRLCWRRQTLRLPYAAWLGIPMAPAWRPLPWTGRFDLGMQPPGRNWRPRSRTMEHQYIHVHLVRGERGSRWHRPTGR